MELLSRDIPKNIGYIVQLGFLPSHGYRPMVDQRRENANDLASMKSK